jgi:hypothetical protein
MIIAPAAGEKPRRTVPLTAVETHGFVESITMPRSRPPASGCSKTDAILT